LRILNVQPRRLHITATLTALTLLIGALALVPAEEPPAFAAPVPSGLPSHFGIGLAASPDNTGIYGWMPNSGIPFDYAYQYLSGGVNTGNGWETWNSSGQFALYYAQGAASHNYIPVFSYYELLQSNGSCGSCGEQQKDLSNLDNASVMSSYFANFRLLMQRLGSGIYGGITGFGKTAIVHVEPDLSGYAEQAVLNNGNCYSYCTGQGNNPAYLKAAVASSGDADVQGYPNTYQGFNWALLHIRDLYAPNVKLAFHVSGWATGQDVDSSSSTSLDATSLGQEVGSFAAQSGITGVPSGTSTYDLLFNDVSDRDAAYYKNVLGDASRWWDRQNVTFPNFHRWESYVSAASQAAGRSVIVWQVPIGNQYFDTEDNTNGHYQDNRAEYFFGHITELANSGIIGVLFGAGNGGSTVQYDGMGDGTTNPASFCTTDGTSSGSVCNNHTSTVSDDDGGYIRMESQQYYANPYPLSGGNPASPTPTTATSTSVPPTSTPVTPTGTSTSEAVSVSNASATPSTVSPGATVNLVATTVSSNPLPGAIIDFEIYDASGTKIYQTYQTANLNAGSQTFNATWPVSTSQTSGTYTLMIGVFGPNWSPDYVWDSDGASIAVGASSATNTPVTPTKTAVPSSTPVKSPTPTSSTTRYGLTTVGTSRATYGANKLIAARISTGSRAETLQSISLYMGATSAAPSNQYSVAVYSNASDRPASLIAQSGTATLNANSWNTIPLSANLSASATYWLVYNTNGASNNLYYNATSSKVGAASSSAVSFGTWPASFGTATLTTGRYSLYATVSP
jgi:hypothetical protein